MVLGRYLQDKTREANWGVAVQTEIFGMEKKRLKRLPPNWQKMDISRLVSPVSGNLHFSIFFYFQPLSGVTSQYRQYLSRVRDSLTHQVFYKHVNVQIQTHFSNSHFFKIMLTSKLQFRQRTVSISTYSGRIMTQVKYQINIFVRSISLSDQYLCHTNAMGMNR